MLTIECLENDMSNIIKVLLAAFLLGCLLNVPYGYFQFIRIACCIGFGYLAFGEFERKKVLTGLICIGLCILLNPIYKIHFTRQLWNKIDVVIAIFLLVWLIVDVYLYYGKSNKKES